MADRKTKGGRKKKADVIDVGEKPAADEADADEDKEEEAEDGVDVDLAAAASTIDVGDEMAEEAPEPKVSAREGSLARRDPLAAYMAETRRYPLLTPEEEHALAV